jgi:PAS domain S-box-containing protein
MSSGREGLNSKGRKNYGETDVASCRNDDFNKRHKEEAMEIPEDITKEQLINDLIKLRRRIDELTKIEEDKNRYLEELNKTKAMYEGLFEFAPDAIVAVNHEGRIVQVNRRTEKLFGYLREELLNSEPDMLLPERFREKHKEHRRTYMSEPRVRPMGTGLELYGRRKNGSEFPVDISLGVLQPVQVETDIVVLAVVRDVTERKESERKLLEAKAELERSNQELEQFAYSVSHDLRAPLRHIEGFISMLDEDFSEKLDEKGRDYIRRVQVGSARMQELISALLDLSRITRGGITRSKVNLTSLVKAAADELQRSHPDRRVEFVIADDVTVDGDSVLLGVVVQNLVDNAFKFTGKQAIARIEFGIKQIAGKPVYFVKDDGVGFNTKNANRLFTPFQRFHSTDEFPGLGIGLATTQRILHHHGGSICAEGEVNKGATFYFTLQ